MFDSKHYTPILKWKRAEQGALKALAQKHKQYITPLVQFVMPKPKPEEKFEDLVNNFEKLALQIPEKIIEAWSQAPIFIDVSLLFTTPLKAQSLKVIGERGSELGGVFIPVIHLNDEQDIKVATFSLAKKTDSGFCLRLICSDFLDMGKLGQDITNILKVSGLDHNKIDLLIDVKETEGDNKKFVQYFDLSQSIADLPKWRTFIFASGSFPENLSECKLDEENLLPRIDWKSWKAQVSLKNLNRKPSFADYTIQHPVYKETTQFFHPTSSIKYTLEDEWFIMKGQKQKFELYLASAAELIKDNKRFFGENFSDGDKYIMEKGKYFSTYIKNPALKGTGSTETWLKAGINHHLSLVAHQVSTLS